MHLKMSPAQWQPFCSGFPMGPTCPAAWFMFLLVTTRGAAVDNLFKRQYLSHPSLGWLYVFSSFPPPPLQWLFLLTSKSFELHLRYLGQRKYRSEKIYWITFGWPWPKVMAVTLINKNLLVCRIKWEPLNQSLQILVAIFLWSLVMFITWLDLGHILFETLFLANFLQKFWMCFFKLKHSIGHISGMIGPIDVKRKGGASVGYWVNYVTLTFDLIHDLHLWFFKVKFQNSCIWGIIIWLMWNKKKAN